MSDDYTLTPVDHDPFAADPSALNDGRPDMTGQYNTQLDPSEEQQFQQWAAANNHVNDLADYDMRGAWKAGAGQSANGHFTDQFKKPNHPTFSTESQYNGADGYHGGNWGGDDSAYTFTPSFQNVRNLGRDGLQSYFNRVEPDGKLTFPSQVTPTPPHTLTPVDHDPFAGDQP